MSIEPLELCNIEAFKHPRDLLKLATVAA